MEVFVIKHSLIKRYKLIEINQITCLIYSVSPSPGSDVARLFAKRSSKSCAPCEIAHKNKECVHCARAYKLRLCALRRCQEKMRRSIVDETPEALYGGWQCHPLLLSTVHIAKLEKATVIKSVVHISKWKHFTVCYTPSHLSPGSDVARLFAKRSSN